MEGVRGPLPHERHACSPDAQLLIDATLVHEHVQRVLVRVRVRAYPNPNPNRNANPNSSPNPNPNPNPNPKRCATSRLRWHAPVQHVLASIPAVC